MSDEKTQIDPVLWPFMESRVVQNTNLILHFLHQNHLKSTFFIMGWIAEKHPELVKRIYDAGHEIGYHSFFHSSPAKQKEYGFEFDLVQGLNILKDIIGENVEYYRAPMFSLDETAAWAIPILMNNGIKVSSSVKSGQKFLGKKVPNKPFKFRFEGQTLIELPLNVLQIPKNMIYTGSGYFRVLPRWFINMHFNWSDYNMAYFHPRDFDVNVPVSSLLPSYRNLMNRLGNKTTLGKLKKMVVKNQFLSIGQALGCLNYHQDVIDIYQKPIFKRTKVKTSDFRNYQ
jgi:peptidoglycan-N-acetylglucosamine deacetylase